MAKTVSLYIRARRKIDVLYETKALCGKVPSFLTIKQVIHEV